MYWTWKSEYFGRWIFQIRPFSKEIGPNHQNWIFFYFAKISTQRLWNIRNKKKMLAKFWSCFGNYSIDYHLCCHKLKQKKNAHSISHKCCSPLCSWQDDFHTINLPKISFSKRKEIKMFGNLNILKMFMTIPKPLTLWSKWNSPSWFVFIIV